MLLEKNELPDWFEYPSELLVLVKQNLLDFDPWTILTGERLRIHYQGLKERYPHRDIIPIAKREGSDDIACFERGREVVIIHDFATSGFERGKQSVGFWDWFRTMVEDMIEYNL